MKSILSTTTACGLLLACSNFAYANNANVETKGGFKIQDSKRPYYSVTLSGVIKFDEVFFFGDFAKKQNEFPSGANLRTLSISLDGGIGPCLTYNTNFSFANGFCLDDAFLTYTGFKANNFEISIGQIASPFCLENNLSTKWIPFLERSLATNAFSPCLGLGVSAIKWGDWYGITLVASQPKQGVNTDTAVKKFRSDRFTFAGRATIAPYLTDISVFHVGGSFVYGDGTTTFRDGTVKTATGDTADGIRFSTTPEAKARNTVKLLDTGIIPFHNFHQLGAEIAYKFGPFWAFGDYIAASVKRPNDLARVNFYGWHVQAAYLLTGESRAYDVKHGKFGKVIPHDPCIGAWEIAARYSMLDLNDKDITGGKEYNTSLSLGWFATENVRFLANYIHARIKTSTDQESRNLNILGFRGQLVF